MKEMLGFLFPAERATPVPDHGPAHAALGPVVVRVRHLERRGDARIAAPRLQPFAGLRSTSSFITGPRIKVDLASGVASLEDGTQVTLSRVVTTTARGIRERRYPHAGPEFHLHTLDGVGVLQDPELARTVFNQAFVLRTALTPYFHPVHVLGTRAQIWQVHGASRLTL